VIEPPSSAGAPLQGSSFWGVPFSHPGRLAWAEMERPFRGSKMSKLQRPDLSGLTKAGSCVILALVDR
jgi:hypothetical protein